MTAALNAFGKASWFKKDEPLTTVPASVQETLKKLGVPQGDRGARDYRMSPDLVGGWARGTWSVSEEYELLFEGVAFGEKVSVGGFTVFHLQDPASAIPQIRRNIEGLKTIDKYGHETTDPEKVAGYRTGRDLVGDPLGISKKLADALLFPLLLDDSDPVVQYYH